MAEITSRLRGLLEDLYEYIDTIGGTEDLHDPWTILDDQEALDATVAEFINGTPGTTTDDYLDIIERLGSYEWSDITPEA